MAVAGLHNVRDSARHFLCKSQKKDTRRTTPASALLQMWLEIEGENVLSQSHRSTYVRYGSENHDHFSQVSDEPENHGFCSSRSENERSNSKIYEQSSDLGEIERGRVRQVFREWTNICPKGRSPNGFNRKNNSRHCISDMECERARDGLVTNHPEIGARRPLRRLCGRQTLLDLSLKAQNERKRELLSLLEQRPVSDFAHRNRIQALLRGRFLRNGRLVVDEKPSSVAATEIGFLRQIHAVSDLREGFLSKLENSAFASMNNTVSDSSCSDENKAESESMCTERRMCCNHMAADLEGATTDENKHMQDLELHNVEAKEPVLDDVVSRENMPVCAASDISREESASNPEAKQHRFLSNEPLESADINCIGASEVYYGVDYIHEVVHHTTDLEGNTNEEFDSHYASAQAAESQELVTDIEDSGWLCLNTVPFTEYYDGSWQKRDYSLSFPGPSINNVEEGDPMQESHHWPRHDSQDDTESWVDVPFGEAGESVGEIDTFDFPYEDNPKSMELRKLFSRRRVSSLLRSGFRDRLDRVLQSYVEKLSHDSVDWELESISEQYHEQLNSDQSTSQSESAEINTFSQQLWNEDFQVVDWPHQYSDQQLKTELDVINELRMDMARLQERVNNMEGMLEACMDMQIDLQRSLHQEVSAALNRSISSGDADEPNGNLIHDESKFDLVKRGICCLCQHGRIDSLLYRCGHMCTCTNCAENLVESKGKCPMCRAPAAAAVRAYFAQ